MSMIFDGFKKREDAEKFVASIELRFGLTGEVYDTEAASDAADPFPFELRPPIAHVPRAEVWTEKQIEQAVSDFGGKFAGT